MDDVTPELRAFLDYVKDIKTNDIFINELEEAVERVKANGKWGHEYTQGRTIIHAP